MGKKAHGRLVHELRAALIRHGFKPTAVTMLATPEGARPVRTPGFSLQKHNDGQSVRLSYRLSREPTGLDRAAVQAQGQVLMRHLVRYHAPLEQAGFVCIELCSRNPLLSYHAGGVLLSRLSRLKGRAARHTLD